MLLKSVELIGFKSFGKKTALEFGSTIAAVVGPNGSGKSNIAEGFRFVLGEQSMKSMRGKRGEDLIWGGSPALPRANRGAVKVVFDNTKRLLDVDFSEVVIERVVHRDGVNEYLLNGTQVRLKDVIRLLAGAHIGGSGYQIISQGEADRILNASPKERREMVEDALGLKLYQHKKIESERKLAETMVNIDKTKSLRREIAPHIKFLGVQVEKIEKAREMRDELSAKLSDYLVREYAWLNAERAHIDREAEERRGAIHALREKLKEVHTRAGSGSTEGLAQKLHDAEERLSAVRREREKLARELGRAEGTAEAHSKERLVPMAHVRSFTEELEKELVEAEKLADAGALKEHLQVLRARIRRFIEELFGTRVVSQDVTHTEQLAHELLKTQEEETKLITHIDEARRAIAADRESAFSHEQEILRTEAAIREAQRADATMQHKRLELLHVEERFKEEVREGIALIGEAVRGYEKQEIPEEAFFEDRRNQEKRRREIERLKIKIEESGIGNSDAVMKEYTHTQERDLFLGKEVADLESSAAKLKDIISDLEQTMDEKFTEGLARINEALAVFFTKLFGGGSAKLFVEKPQRVIRSMARDVLDEPDEEVDVLDEEELYAGLTISVSLPRKKVSGLEVLSGGERALTSIALIFAMSQVHPPPFLILDETDAALDEANSRRFADMIRELSKSSQLVVITHNRATMAVAEELYGITMGQDGVSKLLSVKLEEAERVAK
ncbi:hypothetical protein A2673_02290 [Candidatus Kaiserbacteria bacterium RIFCSPHIGHO2_01_FULL_50_13]|uniref:RecF/RecN/SMC N-terminal domain-containing protein n=1 Tax=Candidatus Kaiserbacteria bacterium RIFCSPLOWO2_01_FULL_50_24 TaxID=1798507 RepID=A0A1F6EMJ6_9BACT|nr:MAG: hypothetical protein A2673_02290 [Candidatus Kaiserbacteria bacterium RIFCSPHIGHO2_01_FULL_50_13]OGG74857.1 MAG: hypothetical protein A3A34_03485 [Candidatus Kaiserbacteria bacterium RIFCSPLOWO2_01_FULL_50_24]OGG81431.1 MAG: hypothetical protein A3H74_03265 [Candidatus Kaiserbacteria bacterium RIFCSPLOWO2_02_FULL_51_13]